MKKRIINNDCIVAMKEMADNSVDSIVTDPPYELGFMGKSWDSTGIANNVEMWKECLRVLKPGGHLLAFSGTRTYHRMASAIEDAGFEVRDMIEYIYGSGFPKSLNIGKAVDKLQGNEREELGRVKRTGKESGTYGQFEGNNMETKGTSEWEGWGTALKPAHEPICMARKPLAEKTVAENCLKWGTGGINIDESRVGTEDMLGRKNNVNPYGSGRTWSVSNTPPQDNTENPPTGRFPANLCWSCDCDNNYLTGNALFDILSNISNQIKLCQSNNSNSNALNVEQKKHQQDTTNEERKLCFAVENVDTLILEKILGKTLEVIFSVDTECSVEMLEESMNTSLSISLYGNEKMEEYQKVLKYITLTATNLITELKTCNLSQSQIIGNFITKVISGIQEQSRVKSHSPECWVRECFPETKGGGSQRGSRKWKGEEGDGGFGGWAGKVSTDHYVSRDDGTGNASRFFKSIAYYPKASKSERNKGCEGLNKRYQDESRKVGSPGGTNPRNRGAEKPLNNFHPTVKPIALMEYLIKMVTRKGGTVLDPFMGSGSTGVACKKNGYNFIGIELEPDYCKIAEARINSFKSIQEELL